MAVYLSNASFQVESHAPGVKGWHPGEKKVQQILDFRHDVADDYSVIRSFLPAQQRIFHTRNIAFLPLAVLDEEGRVWASFLCGAWGTPGFIDSPDGFSLTVHARTWEGDPAKRYLKSHTSPEEGVLVAGVGVEISTRRRNKLAGVTSSVEWSGNDLDLGIKIKEACGNCPKYISISQLIPSRSSPFTIAENLNLSDSDVLPTSVVDFIRSQDTLYLSTSYVAPANVAKDYPSHLGCNHRGGKPGWVRVRTDGRTIVIPDYSGNRFMTSLGNIQMNGVAGVVFPSYSTGSILYVTGHAKSLFGAEASAVQPRSRTVTLITVTGYTFVANALPFRSDPASYQPSPYSPPVRYLAEEKGTMNSFQQHGMDEVEAQLVKTEIHQERGKGENEADLATLTFEIRKAVDIVPGQYVILQAIDPDEIGYAHMTRDGNEKSVNDDGVRTWTISSSQTTSHSTTFSITIRKLGRATKKLFQLASYFSPSNPGAFLRRRVVMPVLGVGGDFRLPSSIEIASKKMVWIAGGIGITPFLAFLEGLKKEKSERWDIDFYISTKEPELILDLVDKALATSPTSSSLDHAVTPELNIDFSSMPSSNSSSPSLSIKLFSTSTSLDDLDLAPSGTAGPYDLKTIKGRIDAEAFRGAEKDCLYYLCGPKPFENAVMKALQENQVDESKIVRESFEF